MAASASRGKLLEERLLASLAVVQRGPLAGGRERPVIWGVTPSGTFVEGMTAASFLAEAGRILVDSGRVYRWENSLVCEWRDSNELLLLSLRGKVETEASSILSNLFVVGVLSTECESLPPGNLVKGLLNDEDLWPKLPRITTYSQRPVYDEEFRLLGPGWHSDSGVLVHGADIVPTPPSQPPGEQATNNGSRRANSSSLAESIARLPPMLQRLLREFCWASAADLENYLSLILAGFLNNHFVTIPKPMGFIDGNQRGIGKTLLVDVLGIILDGKEPERIRLCKDEELEKKMSAKLRESKSCVFFFDNVKSTIDSPLIEANALSPIISLRLLGHSRNITRPNTYLWLVTSNQTCGSTDIVSRAVAIRLYFEGNTTTRTFQENPVDFATRNRSAILGEVAGMVEHWKDMGRRMACDVWPTGQATPRHRCQHYADLVGGILGANGLTSFLGNTAEAQAAMDEGLQTLAALAEHAVKSVIGAVNPAPQDGQRGLSPREWVAVFQAAGLYRDRLADKSSKARETFVGTYLSGKTDRAVTVTAGTATATAVLRRNEVRSGQKRYFFEVQADAAPDSPASLVGAVEPCHSGAASEPSPADVPVVVPGSTRTATSPSSADETKLEWC